MRTIHDPTHTDVDLALGEIAAEEERQREAIRRFREACRRERPGVFVSAWQALKFFLIVLGAAAAIYAFAVLWFLL